MYSSLWYDDAEDVLYSGFTGRVSNFGDAPKPFPFSLWSFKPDGTGSGSWKEVIDSGSSVWDSYTRPCQPMVDFGSGSAYILGGFENSRTALAAANLSSSIPIPGLVQFNLTTQKFSNSTAGGYSFNGTAEKGAMHYVPSFGSDGLFVVMGGDDFWHSTAEQLVDLETIQIYDPSSGRWFNQTTTGNIPPGRKEFCLAGIPSNNATYEMYDRSVSLPCGYVSLIFAPVSCMRAGQAILELWRFLTMRFTFSPCLLSIGSKSIIHPSILDMVSLATL